MTKHQTQRPQQRGTLVVGGLLVVGIGLCVFCNVSWLRLAQRKLDMENHGSIDYFLPSKATAQVEPTTTTTTATTTPPETVLRLIKPPPRADNKTVALCACMREEEKNVDEWVDFHLGIGFAQIHIYDNTELFELEQWARERQEVFGDPITITHVPQHNGVQRRVYRDCAEKMYQAGHDYAGFWDVDEFLVIQNRTQYPHPIDLLLEQAPTGELCVEMLVFGQAHRKTYEPIPVTKKFQFSTTEGYRMNQLTKGMVHLPSFNFSAKEFASPHYVPIKRPETKIHWAKRSDVKLYHYTFKSRMEHVRKYLKGSAWYKERKGHDQALEGKTSRGDKVPQGTIFDDTAWQILKMVAPRYAFYDQFYQIPHHIPDEHDEDEA